MGSSKTPAEPPTGAKLAELVEDRLAPLSPEILLTETDYAVLGIDLVRLFRWAPRYALVVAASCAAVARRGTIEPDWLDRLLLIDLPGTASRTRLVVYLLATPGSKQRATAYISTQSAGAGQPMMPAGSVLSARNPVQALRNGVVGRADPALFSPYRIDHIASGPLFVGRAHLLKQLRGAKGGQVIVGPRRIGKSSLSIRLQQVLGDLERQDWQGSQKSIRRCAYLDVSELGSDITTIWTKILQRFNLKSRDYAVGGRLTRLIRAAKHDEWESLVDDHEALAATIRSLPGELTIILDEVDGWIESEASAGWPTLDRLRAMSDGGKARVLLVGYESLMLAADNDRFPFAGRGTRVRLGPLTREDVKTLVCAPMNELGIKLINQEELLNLIWHASSGMPHIVQDICQGVVNLLPTARPRRGVTLTLLQTAIDAAPTVQTMRRGVINCAMPLAEAVAGVLSQAGHYKAERGRHSARALTNGAIAERLEKEAGFVFDNVDFERATAFLELRYIIQPSDESRTSWMWVNGLAMANMSKMVRQTGLGRWLRSLLRRHRSGEWRARYDTFN